jgi:hypothetical protein
MHKAVNKTARIEQGLRDGLASSEDDRRINFDEESASADGQARPVAGGGSEEGVTRVDDEYIVVGEQNAQQEKHDN